MFHLIHPSPIITPKFLHRWRDWHSTTSKSKNSSRLFGLCVRIDRKPTLCGWMSGYPRARPPFATGNLVRDFCTVFPTRYYRAERTYHGSGTGYCRQLPTLTAFSSLLPLAGADHRQSRLFERGHQYRLRISVDFGWRADSTSASVLCLIAQHSRRRQQLEKILNTVSITSLAEVRLETLSLGGNGFQLADISVFETAPKLTQVFSNGASRACPRLAWSQLRSSTFHGGNPSDILGLIRNMSHPEAAFELRNWDGVIRVKRLLAQSVLKSTVTSLLVETMHFRVIVCLLARLTLPRLRRELHFPSNRQVVDIPWRFIVDEFEALSLRSSFSATLRTFDISQVRITAEELVRCLASMPLLERLSSRTRNSQTRITMFSSPMRSFNNLLWRSHILPPPTSEIFRLYLVFRLHRTRLF
ncbi:hypothetical protein C8R43DRAFT_1026160 [Mycena crocata]|nr:hypothetical protein C8R43DRAFT_1026160 [Mycena crocata]